MLKQKKKKNRSKNTLYAFKQVGKESAFKNSSIGISTDELFFQSLDKLNKIAELPKPGQQTHIVTQNAINSFDFILAILANSTIKTLHIAFYRIGKKVVTELHELLKSGKIEHIHLLINDGFPKLVPDCWNLIKSLESEHFKIRVENNHTKIILADTETDTYIIEGSGNLSINARIEQYIIMNNPEVYNFHKTWIEAI